MTERIKTQESINNFKETQFLVNNEPVMEIALEVLTILTNTNEIRIKGKGETCPNAVAVANIITENMLKGKSKIVKVIVDSEIIDNGYMISTIDIILKKIN